MNARIATVIAVALIACRDAAAPERATPEPPKRVAAPSFFTAPDALAIAGELGGADVPKMRVHLIDVGQGASTLIEFSCAAMLVDAGGEENEHFHSTDRLVRYLDEFFASRPDLKQTLALLVITHPHIDHDRGAAAVFERYHVKNVVTDGLTYSSGGKEQAALIESAKQAGVGLEAIDAKAVPPRGLSDTVIDPVKCDDADPDIRVLWGAAPRSWVAWDDKPFANANNHSVVTKVTLGKASILITGDLEVEGINALLERHGPAVAADVYQVGHHGSWNGTTKELVDAVAPKLALLAIGSVSRQETFSAWAFGHPRDVTIDVLEHVLTGRPRPPITEPIGLGAKKFEDRKITAPIFATGWDGDVRVTMRADGAIGVVTRNTVRDR
jgi:competence protein ComEC